MRDPSRMLAERIAATKAGRRDDAEAEIARLQVEEAERDRRATAKALERGA